MEQLDLIDWIDSKRVIKALPPAEAIAHRRFIIEQLKPIMRELEALQLSPMAISEAMAFYQNRYKDKAQEKALQEVKAEGLER